MSQAIEISIYILIAAAMFVYRTILSGRKNGCFYHKNDIPLPLMLDREIRNIHFIETDAWRAQGFAISLLIFAIERSLNYTTVWWEILIQIGISLLIMGGTIQAPSYHFQRGITAGMKDDDHLDSISKSEVAITVFGWKIQFWKGRLFNNRGRKVAQWLGIIEILGGVGLMVWFNLLR